MPRTLPALTISLSIEREERLAEMLSYFDGRLENAEDDADDPEKDENVQEIRAAIEWLEGQTIASYPATLDLSEAPLNVWFQIAVTLEGLDDYDDGGGEED